MVGGGGSGAQTDRQQKGYEWGGREPRRIGCRRDVSEGGGGREPRRIGSWRDMSRGGG